LQQGSGIGVAASGRGLIFPRKMKVAKTPDLASKRALLQ
jgi:hypothetical protein